MRSVAWGGFRGGSPFPGRAGDERLSACSDASSPSPPSSRCARRPRGRGRRTRSSTSTGATCGPPPRTARKKVQLTDGGDWHSPTQADDGTIAAVKGTGPIQVMGSRRPAAAHDHDAAGQRSGDGGAIRAASRRPVLLPGRLEDRLRLRRQLVPGGVAPAATIQRSTFYTRGERHGGRRRSASGQPVRRLEPGVGHQRPHARLRRGRQRRCRSTTSARATTRTPPG